jgi:hypothetical protein
MITPPTFGYDHFTPLFASLSPSQNSSKEQLGVCLYRQRILPKFRRENTNLDTLRFLTQAGAEHWKKGIR